MINKMKKLFFQPGFISYIISSFLVTAIWLAFPQPVTAAPPQFNIVPKKRSVLGQDLNFSIQIDGDVVKAQVFIRPLAEMGEFTSFKMQSTGGKTFSCSIPLSQDPAFNWEPVEYYFSAESRSGHRLDTRKYILSFIDAPPVNQPIVLRSKSLNDHEWKYLIEGPRFYKRAWFWVGVVAVAGIGAAFLLNKSDEPSVDPLDWKFRPDVDDKRYSFGEEIDISAGVTGGSGNLYIWTLEIYLPNRDAKPDAGYWDAHPSGGKWHQSENEKYPDTLCYRIKVEGDKLREQSFKLTINQQPEKIQFGIYNLLLKVESGKESLKWEGKFRIEPPLS